MNTFEENNELIRKQAEELKRQLNLLKGENMYASEQKAGVAANQPITGPADSAANIVVQINNISEGIAKRLHEVEYFLNGGPDSKTECPKATPSHLMNGLYLVLENLLISSEKLTRIESCIGVKR